MLVLSKVIWIGLQKPYSVALPGTPWPRPAGKLLRVLSLPETAAALGSSNSAITQPLGFYCQTLTTNRAYECITAK